MYCLLNDILLGILVVGILHGSKMLPNGNIFVSGLDEASNTSDGYHNFLWLGGKRNSISDDFCTLKFILHYNKNIFLGDYLLVFLHV